MERQAVKTEAAINSLGRNMDAVGTADHAKQIDRYAQAERNVTRETAVMDRQMGRTRRTVQGMRRDTKNLGDSTIRLGAIFSSVTKVLKPLAFFALATAIRPLIALVGALGVGLVAMIPNLLRLGGAAAALPAVLTGFGLALTTVSLATKDLSEALGGNKKALDRLTPAARDFVTTLKQYKPVLDDLRKTAQEGLFPGLEYSVRRLQRAVPMVQSLIGRMSRQLGRQAGSWANLLTSPSNLRDLQALGNQGVTVFGRISRGAQHLAGALIDIASAARPFTDWLTGAMVRGTRNFERFIGTARRTGALADYFDRVRDSLTQVWHISGNLGRTLMGIFRASSGLGQSLWDGLERVTKNWADFTNSVAGQSRMTRAFDAMRPTLREIGGLVGDLARALGRLAGRDGQRDATRMLAAMRGWVPTIERILSTASRFGPTMADSIGQLLRIFDALTDPASGPLAAFLQMTNTALHLFADLLEKVRPVAGLLQAAFAIFLGRALAIRIANLGASVLGLATRWGMVATQANAAAAAQARAGGAAVAGGAGPAVLPNTRSGAGAVAASAYRPAGRFSRVGGVIARNAGRFANPALLVGSIGATYAGQAVGGTGGALLSGAGQGAAIGATLGSVVPGIGTGIGAGVGAVAGAGLSLWSHNRQRDAAAQAAGTAAGQRYTNVGDAQARLRAVEAAASEKRTVTVGAGTMGAHQETQNVRSSPVLKRLRAEAAAIKEMLPELRAAMKARGKELNRESRDHAKGLLTEFGKAYTTYEKSYGPSVAMHKTTSNVLNTMRRMKPAGARVLAENTLAWAQEQAKGNPKMLREVQRLRDGIKRRFAGVGRDVQIVNGKIITGSKSDWERIRAGLQDKAEKAREQVSKAFTSMQNQAVGALVSMGYSKSDARRIVQAGEHGNRAANNAVTGVSATGGDTGATQAATNRSGAAGTGATGGASTSVTAAATPVTVGGGTGDGPGSDLGRAGSSAAAQPTATTRTASSGGLMGASGDLQPYANDAAGFGLHVSSGLRPGAITNAGNVSYHSSGRALDLAGDPASMLAFAKHAADSYGGQLEELIHTPMGFSIKNGARVAPYAAADHYDHVHLADAQAAGALAGAGAGGAVGGAGGVGGAQISPLVAGASGLGGVPGALADAANSAIAAGLTAQINQQLAGGGAAVGGAVGGGNASAGGQYDKASLASLWVSAGGDPSVASLMAAIALAESGGNPSAHNPSGASGLWQILGNPFPGNAMDPTTNARMAVSKYGSQGLGAWEAYTNGSYRRYAGDGWGHDGGSIQDFAGWFGSGGTITANRPTLIGIGEAGKETATVVRGDGGGGSRTMHVTINVSGDGPNVQRHVEQALRNVARDLDLTPLEQEV